MGDYRGDHYGAVENAINAISSIQEFIAMATQQTDVAMGAILSATGSTQIESAQNAMNFIAGTRDKLEETYAATEQAVAELHRYQEGF